MNAEIARQIAEKALSDKAEQPIDFILSEIKKAAEEGKRNLTLEFRSGTIRKDRTEALRSLGYVVIQPRCDPCEFFYPMNIRW